MLQLSTFDPWWRFGVALIIGALIGLEREFNQQKEREPDFAGIRTFSLTSLLGAVSAFAAGDFANQPLVIAFAGIVLLTVASYFAAFLRTREEGGITTEVALLLCFLLGVLSLSDNTEIAIALAVIVALLLSLKQTLHALARRMSADDLRVTLEFAMVALVVLPILPNRTIDPFGVLNPSQVWLLVVFVSGIGFAGYVLMKTLGAEQGIGLTGLLGGIVSSTATTVSFSTRSKQAPRLSQHFAQAILLASSVMFPRVLIEVFVVNARLLPLIAVPLGAMLLTGLIGVYLLQRHAAADETSDDESVDLANPLKLSTAIMFGLVFAVVLTGVKFASEFFGNAGVYVASVITGLTDVDAITLSVSRLTREGQLNASVASTAIVIASVMNTIAKAGIAITVGAPEMRKVILRAFGAIVLVGTISVGVMLLV